MMKILFALFAFSLIGCQKIEKQYCTTCSCNGTSIGKCGTKQEVETFKTNTIAEGKTWKQTWTCKDQ